MADEEFRAMPEDKIAAETLDLRAQPRPVTRLNKRVLIGLSGMGLVLLFVATFYALSPPNRSGSNNKELYNVNQKEKPEELSSLPKSYKGYKTPVLGPPLPGEFGGAVLGTERRLGL